MKKIALFTLLSAFLLALGGRAAYAQDVPPPIPTEPICIDCPVPMPPIWHMEGLEIPYQRVDVTIENQVATTHIEQLFRNNNDWMLEGNYFFPLPKGAAVSQLTMWIDGRPIEAKILEKDEARAIYDEIVRQLRDPALLEYVGSDAIQANVFPIPPGEERLIEIEYNQVLMADNGAFHYVFPQSTDLYSNAPLETQSIRVDLRSDEAIRTIYSPSHPVAVSRNGEYQAVVGYEGNDVYADTDFELYYTVSPEDIGLNLLSYKEPGEDGFFLLLVAPGIEPGEVTAKDVIIVLDVSGSMDGGKLEQAQEAARYVVEHLNPEDRFNVVAFSTGVSLYEPRLLPATAPGDYAQYIDSLEPTGGTNISQALLEAAALVDPERPTTIIFLTDGLPTEGITDTPLLLDTVAQSMPDNARLFAFGVGDDVDTTLLDTLAQEYRGTTTYVRPGEDINEAVSGFYARVGAPVLTDLLLDYGGVRVDQQYPVELPDLFAGSQMVVAGRYRDGGPATITLTGEANGREQTFTYPDQTFRESGGESFIARLWATRAVGHMMQQIRLRGENPELVQSIVNLSTRYGIITPYTSFLIEEKDIFSQTGMENVVEEAAAEMAAPADVSGEAAVDRAVAEEEMAEAAAPMAVQATRVFSGAGGEAVAGLPAILNVGDKTFVLRDGVYIDTTFDSERYEPQTVAFASDAYFDLLAARPDLGPYLALGERVLVVVGDQAYRITSEGGETAEIELPAEISAETGLTETTGDETGVEQPPVAGEPASSARAQVCASALILPLLAVVGFGAFGRRRQSRK